MVTEEGGARDYGNGCLGSKYAKPITNILSKLNKLLWGSLQEYVGTTLDDGVAEEWGWQLSKDNIPGSADAPWPEPCR